MTFEEQMFQIYGPILVVGLILAWRLRTLSRERPLDPARLWIAPAILVALAIWVIAMMPPGALGLAIAGLTFAAGLALGWQRGKLIRIWHDRDSGKLMQKASPAAILLLVGVLALRFGIRQYAEVAPSADGQIHGTALIVTDALLTFAVGLVAATRVELMVRARRIMASEERVAG